MTILTNEERLEEEIAEKRQYLEEYATEKQELRRRLDQLSALIATPLIGEESDVAAFGRGAWVYCRAHVQPHQTGWCSVSIRDKIGLGVFTAEEAHIKCAAWKLKIFHYNK